MNGEKGMKTIVLAVALCVFGRPLAAQETKSLETLTEQVATLQKRLDAAAAQIASLQSTVSALNANEQRLRNNDSTFVSILSQWVTGLETWKGSHFLHHMLWQNNWDVVKYARLESADEFWAYVEKPRTSGR